jgi:hypothetical protein
LVPRLVRLEERSFAGRGGTRGLRFVHHGGSRVELPAKPDRAENGAGRLSTNNWSFIKAHIGEIMTAVDAAKAGSYTEVEIPLG